MSAEVWRLIPQNLNYWISSHGRVASRKSGTIRILKPIRGHGYLNISMWTKRQPKGEGRWLVDIHHLVAAAFIGPRPEKHDINHKNGIKYDNRVENLEYVTRSQNALHAFKNGLNKAPAGESHNRAKLTNEIVLEIRRLYSNGGYSYADLGRLFRVTKENISYIVNRKTWREI